MLLFLVTIFVPHTFCCKWFLRCSHFVQQWNDLAHACFNVVRDNSLRGSCVPHFFKQSLQVYNATSRGVYPSCWQSSHIKVFSSNMRKLSQSFSTSQALHLSLFCADASCIRHSSQKRDTMEYVTHVSRLRERYIDWYWELQQHRCNKGMREDCDSTTVNRLILETSARLVLMLKNFGFPLNLRGDQSTCVSPCNACQCGRFRTALRAQKCARYLLIFSRTWKEIIIYGSVSDSL